MLAIRAQLPVNIKQYRFTGFLIKNLHTSTSM